MNKRKVIPLVSLALGVVLISMGLTTYYLRAQETTLCDACGMEITKTSPSTFTIQTSDGKLHYGCCPMCALTLGVYYNNALITGKCYECGEQIEFIIKNQSITSMIPNDPQHNVTMIYGKSCMNNKLVCSQSCANTLKKTNMMLAEFPIITTQDMYFMAKAKISQFTINTKSLPTQTNTLIVLIVGTLLTGISPVLWVYLNRKR